MKGKNIIAFIIVSIFIIATTACTDKDLIDDDTARGEVVKGEVRTSVLPFYSPQSGGARSTETKKGFTVSLTPDKGTESRAESNFALYNMWAIQFDEFGVRQGMPQRLSDNKTPVYAHTALAMDLVVGTKQTLYFVVFGPNLDVDITNLNTLAKLEALRFPYSTVAPDGSIRSLVTTEEEIPYSGSISGLTIKKSGTGKGYIDPETMPDPNSGIPLNRLMSKVTMRYYFNVPNYTVDNVQFKKAIATVGIKPDAPQENAAYVDLDSKTGTSSTMPDYQEATWYVGKNTQGTRDIIVEEDRYYQESDPASKAPANGSNFVVTARKGSGTDIKYSQFQIFIGNNNTSNFDLNGNARYTFTTNIDLSEDDLVNTGDKRITAVIPPAEASVIFDASAIMIEDGKPLSADASNDFDAYYDSKSITIIPKYPGSATIKIRPYSNSESIEWIKASTSPNYTEAVNNMADKLSTEKTVHFSVPKQIKLYLYCDEYVLNTNKPYDPTYIMSDKNQMIGYIRQAYVDITITNETGTVTKKYGISQRQATMVGQFGGMINEDMGQYEKQLFMNQLRHYERLPKANVTKQLPWGYFNKHFKMENIQYENGKEMTKLLAENNDNYNITGGSGYFPVQPKNPVDLYQYDQGDTYVARFCYDRNRDLNGNGKLDENEIKWYVPTVNQLMGIHVTAESIYNITNAWKYCPFYHDAIVGDDTGKYNYVNTNGLWTITESQTRSNSAIAFNMNTGLIRDFTKDMKSSGSNVGTFTLKCVRDED